MILIVSHDRELLITLQQDSRDRRRTGSNSGNYSQHKQQKEMELERFKFEYQQYLDNKRALEEAIKEKEQNTSMKAPSRMGNRRRAFIRQGIRRLKQILRKQSKLWKLGFISLKKENLRQQRNRYSNAEKPVSIDIRKWNIKSFAQG